MPSIDDTRKSRGRPKVGATQLAVRVPPTLLSALDQFIAEEQPGISRPEALRVLASEQLIALGILAPDERT